MKETINELEKKLTELSEKCGHIDKAMNSIALIDFEDKEKKRSMIDDLRQLGYKFNKERQNVIDAISALQKVCTHTNPDGSNAYHYCGHDSHYSYERCDICGKEQST
jgi:Holliday junction resolvasome RuvABC DNA-binding subunit